MGNKTIFALDIGTRSVVGLIMKEEGNQYEIIDIVVKEHVERSMLDGQIHDVLAVSKVIFEMKEVLEKKHGKLEKVCVAAAGRALKTERSAVTIDIAGKPMIQKENITHLELSAVQQAQVTLASKHQIEKSHHYYCVGYSVINYQLDHEELGSLIDQQGDKATVEIIATFLPKVVVESLISALNRAELEMEALTLEPIAAINVLIPPTMRRLNVALVDIGAGTSDIAITDRGTVIAYGMVPIAGDEITEAISDQFLLDFPLAEKAKRDLHSKETITITDILGFEADIARQDVIKQISEAIDKLAIAICDELLKLNNQKPPKAVMLVGGGSLTPELPKRLANRLGLPENRVAIRGIDAIQKLSLADHVQKGPEFVTPIGIAIAAKQSPVQYISVSVNEKPVRLFDIKKLTIGDCLLAAGITMNKLYGKPGMAMMITLNNQDITIPGNYGSQPILQKNGINCSLNDQIQHGDFITVERGSDGAAATIKIQDLLDEAPTKEVFVNGKKYVVNAMITQNGNETSLNSFVKDHDVIICKYPETICEMFKLLNQIEELALLKPFKIEVNGRTEEIKQFSGKILKNGQEVSSSSRFHHDDSITIQRDLQPTCENLAEIINLPLEKKNQVTYHGQEIILKKTMNELYRHGAVLHDKDTIHNDDKIQVISKRTEPFIFQDLFRHIEVDMPANASGRFVLLRNNEEVTFHDEISPGDELKIEWHKKNANASF